MPIRAIVDTLDGLEPAIAALYSEQTVAGKTVFVLAVEGVDTLPAVRGLKVANDTNRQKLTTAQTELAAAMARLEGLPEDFDGDAYEALRTSAEKGTKAPDPQELERIVNDRVAKATKKANDEKAKAEAERDKIRGQRDATERNRVLNDELDAAGVTDPIFRKAARAMLAAGALIIDDELEGVSVMFRDPDLGTQIPAKTFIGDWAKSEEGKAFVGARDNQGGGAGGGNRPPTGGTGNFTKDNFNLTEFGQLVKVNPAEARRIAIACGKPEYAPDL